MQIEFHLKCQRKILGCKIQDISTSILIAQILTTVTGEGEGKDESDKLLEARDRRYSCLINMRNCNCSLPTILSTVSLFYLCF